MSQDSLFPSGSVDDVARLAGRKRVLITVTTAPNPSDKHGETVCVAGIELGDTGPTNWVRLYPINLRDLRSSGAGFRKYNVVAVDCTPALKDSRPESFNVNADTLIVEYEAKGWPKRRPSVDPMVEDSMCALLQGARDNPNSRSLGLVRPAEVSDLRIAPHPGWSVEEQAKIDNYVNQMQLFSDEERQPLQAPRFKGWFKWRCHEPGCSTHEQSILDWEFTELQRNLAGRDDADAITELRKRFFEVPFGSDRSPAFYVGNQAKHRNTFMVLGLYYPRKSD